MNCLLYFVVLSGLAQFEPDLGEYSLYRMQTNIYPSDSSIAPSSQPACTNGDSPSLLVEIHAVEGFKPRRVIECRLKARPGLGVLARWRSIDQIESFYDPADLIEVSRDIPKLIDDQECGRFFYGTSPDGEFGCFGLTTLVRDPSCLYSQIFLLMNMKTRTVLGKLLSCGSISSDFGGIIDDPERLCYVFVTKPGNFQRELNAISRTGEPSVIRGVDADVILANPQGTRVAICKYGDRSSQLEVRIANLKETVWQRQFIGSFGFGKPIRFLWSTDGKVLALVHESLSTQAVSIYLFDAIRGRDLGTKYPGFTRDDRTPLLISNVNESEALGLIGVEKK